MIERVTRSVPVRNCCTGRNLPGLGCRRATSMTPFAFDSSTRRDFRIGDHPTGLAHQLSFGPMKKLMRLVFILFAFMLLLHPAQAKAQQSGTRCSNSLFPISGVLTKAVTAVRSKTSVPIRLPTCISGFDSAEELHAIVKSVDGSRYVVVLGATPECEGQHVCSYGTMIGTSLPLNRIGAYDVTRRPRSLVDLHRRIKGYFYASVCGAYCSDSFITWTEGAYHYIIGLKA